MRPSGQSDLFAFLLNQRSWAVTMLPGHEGLAHPGEDLGHLFYGFRPMVGRQPPKLPMKVRFLQSVLLQDSRELWAGVCRESHNHGLLAQRKSSPLTRGRSGVQSPQGLL